MPVQILNIMSTSHKKINNTMTIATQKKKNFVTKSDGSFSWIFVLAKRVPSIIDILR